MIVILMTGSPVFILPIQHDESQNSHLRVHLIQSRITDRHKNSRINQQPLIQSYHPPNSQPSKQDSLKSVNIDVIPHYVKDVDQQKSDPSCFIAIVD
jgi:hypothetical protein